jgi:EPS-associated MarR family transcriptional regulator
MTEERSVLSVLESLSEAPDTPQRKLAASTGLNLAKVNFVLRRLVDKGYVKLKRVRDNPHKLRYLYLLTPEGVAEKSRLTYRFLRRTLQEYGAAERRVADSVESMAAQGVHAVVLWGATEIAELCLKLIEGQGNGMRVLGVVDPTGRHPRALHPSQVAVLAPDAVVACDAEPAGLPPGIPVWKLM